MGYSRSTEPFPPVPVSVQKLEKVLAVVVVTVPANTRKNLASILINVAHAGYLDALLVIVDLVDTYGVNPEVAALFPARLHEDVLAVAANLHPLAVDEDDREGVRIPPRV